MRRISFILLVVAGCARPVLYYPTLEAAGVSTSTSSSNAVAPGTTLAIVEPDSVTASMSDEEYLFYRHLLVPVAGADMSRVTDSFNAGRSGGRVHRAIDILAPRGTPVLAADDGRILRMSFNRLGGITLYAVDAEARLVYYYAHMERYNDAMFAGRVIARGDTLGYVGTTGNAPENVPHLHFQVMRWPADGKYWYGDPIDPFEALGGVPRGRRGAPR